MLRWKYDTSCPERALFTDEQTDEINTVDSERRENIFAREDVSSFESLVVRFYLSARRWTQYSASLFFFVF